MTNKRKAKTENNFPQQPYKTLQQSMIEEELEKGDPNGWVHDMEKELEKFERENGD